MQVQKYVLLQCMFNSNIVKYVFSANETSSSKHSKKVEPSVCIGTKK